MAKTLIAGAASFVCSHVVGEQGYRPGTVNETMQRFLSSAFIVPTPVPSSCRRCPASTTARNPSTTC